MINACLQQAKLAAEFKEKTIPLMFPVLQKHVKDGHVIGSDGVSCFVTMLLCMCMCTVFIKSCVVIISLKKLSWVDIQGYFLLDMISTNFGVNLTDYPELKKLVDGVASQPNIKNWIETRPKTDF